MTEVRVYNNGRLNFTIYLTQALNIEVINFRDQFKDTLTLIKATNSIKMIQVKFKQYYYSPNGAGGKKIMNRLNHKQLSLMKSVSDK